MAHRLAAVPHCGGEGKMARAAWSARAGAYSGTLHHHGRKEAETTFSWEQGSGIALKGYPQELTSTSLGYSAAATTHHSHT